MTNSTKIDFRYRRICLVDDITDLAEMLFPGNRNQQHAAARILLRLKAGDGLLKSLADLEREHGISRRTLERARAKLARLGLIEHVTWMNSRYGGQSGWKLSSRFESTLKQLSQKCSSFRNVKTDSKEKDLMLVEYVDAQRNTQQGKMNQ